MYEWKEHQELLGKINNVCLTAPDNYVFAKSNGAFRTEGGTRKTFQRFLKRHNLDGKGIHFHALRQTFPTRYSLKTKGYYKSLQKFDSVREAAKKFNELYKPKNTKYCAQENCTFVSEGYVTENDSIRQVAKKNEPKQESPLDVLTRLKTEFPEVYAALVQKK